MPQGNKAHDKLRRAAHRSGTLQAMIPLLLTLTIACAPTSLTPSEAWPESGCVAAPPSLDDTDGRLRREALRITLADGVTLAAELVRPRGDGCWPGLMLIPPGFEPGLPIQSSDAVDLLAQSGLVVLTYDPRGRGLSEGVEDHNGPVHQDDLAALLRTLASQPEVDPDQVVARSRSFGVATLAGALARHPDLTPMAVMDIEGPALLPDDLAHAPARNQETLTALATDPQWWEDRSAALHIGAYTGHYRRVQAQNDHVMGEWLGHAAAMLDAAAAGEAARVDENGLESESWAEDEVQALSLEGRVKADDPRAIELLIDLYAPTIAP